MKALQFNATVPGFIGAKALEKVVGRKVYYKGPLSTIKLLDIPEPVLPSQDWVKLETLYCGFCGSDLNLICLHDSPTATPFSSLPCTPGHEVVAKVIQAGKNTTGYAKGDVVAINPFLPCETRDISPLCPSCSAGKPTSCENFAKGNLAPGMFIGINNQLNGGFAPYLVAHKSQLHKVPKGLSLESAVMAEPLAVSLQAVFDNKPEPGDKILVIGGGVIGNLIIQSIRAIEPDCDISLVEPLAFAAQNALKFGADRVIAHDNIFAESAKITSATSYKPQMGMPILMGGFNKIFDTVGNSATLHFAMRILATLGTLSLVGIGPNVTLDPTPLWLKHQTVKGMYAYGFARYKDQLKDTFGLSLELMAKGLIDAQALVTHTFRLEQYQQMFQVNLNKGQHKAIKTIVSFLDDPQAGHAH